MTDLEFEPHSFLKGVRSVADGVIILKAWNLDLRSCSAVTGARKIAWPASLYVLKRLSRNLITPLRSTERDAMDAENAGMSVCMKPLKLQGNKYRNSKW